MAVRPRGEGKALRGPALVEGTEVGPASWSQLETGDALSCHSEDVVYGNGAFSSLTGSIVVASVQAASKGWGSGESPMEVVGGRVEGSMPCLSEASRRAAGELRSSHQSLRFGAWPSSFLACSMQN